MVAVVLGGGGGVLGGLGCRGSAAEEPADPPVNR